ncbi:hypothetical protein [Limnospira platensis]|uniref:hypothetical protein n=1 Tax=Limnospira platensis TaxID=118562 RepID=UPI00396C7C67
MPRNLVSHRNGSGVVTDAAMVLEAKLACRFGWRKALSSIFNHPSQLGSLDLGIKFMGWPPVVRSPFHRVRSP